MEMQTINALQSAYNGDGEDNFFKYIKNNCKVIFDVGCFAGIYDNGDKAVNPFTQLNDVDVHYFDPVPEYVDEVEEQIASKDRSFLNRFGLSDTTGKIPYYSEVMSFVERSKTLPHRVTDPDRMFDIKRGDVYVKENNIKSIDFLKIDVEGFEKGVIEGFGDSIKNIKIIQFEYGGCWIDSEIKLVDVVEYLKHAGFTNFGRLYNNGIIPLGETFVDDYNFSNMVCHNKNNYNSWEDDKFKG